MDSGSQFSMRLVLMLGVVLFSMQGHAEGAPLKEKFHLDERSENAIAMRKQ